MTTDRELLEWAAKAAAAQQRGGHGEALPHPSDAASGRAVKTDGGLNE